MKAKILLQENDFTANQYIGIAERRYSNWSKLESLFMKMGLDPKTTENMDQLNAKLQAKFQFKEATKEFNLEALGVTGYYNEAVKLLNSNDWSKQEPTPESIEAIRETYRVYANSENQIEAYNLCKRMFNDIARAKELGILEDFMLLPFSENCNVYGYRIKNEALNSLVMNVS